ncbi:MAG: molybdopterin-dependent oxidoreductase, partial [Proteobacteria bacterium]|nr:molybdopterin-dependent oxidoreductase [Pseudomonadota bacterium]
ASQTPHSYQSQIAAICKLPRDKVQMETTVAGGAFGAKADMSIQHLCALATLVTGRPVRLDLSREESIRASVKRHPFTMECETGADETGRLTHARVRALADAGAYTSATPAVADNAAVFATGPYQVDHLDVKVTAAFTNNPTCGAMRGFGVPQVCLAMERQMDELAARLGLDPIEMRLKNALDQGKVSQWGQVMGQGVGVKACLRALQKATRGAKNRAARDFDLKPGERVGLGFATGYKNTSFPTNWPPNMNLGQAEVTFALNRHGKFVVYVGGSELGQGLVTALAEIAAQGLGVPAARIKIVFGSTRHTRAPIQTTSSQQTFLTGGAVLDAAPRFGRKILAAAAQVWPAVADKLSLGPEGLEAGGEKIASYHEVAWRCALAGHKLRLSHTYMPPIKTIAAPHRVRRVGSAQVILPSLGYAAQAALVAVHRRTGQVRVLEIFAAQDAGRTIFRAGVEGQVEGGVMMGLGWCLKERLRIEQGRVVTDNLDTYFVPRTEDTPRIVPLIVEVPDPLGPLGAKGIGEVPVLPTAPAVLNAIRDAVNVSLTRIPVSTAEIRRRMREARS